jgi:hypothetical protein
MPKDDRRLEEQHVAEVLRRAVELDAVRQGSMTIGEVRAIAEEIGTSRWAVDQALAELGSETVAQDGSETTWRERVASWKPLATLTALEGVAIGAAMFGMKEFIGGTNDYGSLGVALTALVSLVLANVLGGKTRRLAFQKSNMTLWAAFAATMILAWPSETDDIVIIVSMMLAGSAVLGAMMTEWHHRRHISRKDGPRSPETMVMKILHRVRGRVDAWLQDKDMEFVAQSKRVGSRQAFS